MTGIVTCLKINIFSKPTLQDIKRTSSFCGAVSLLLTASPWLRLLVVVKNVALLLDFVWFSVGLAVFAGSHRVIVHHHVHSVLPPLVAISFLLAHKKCRNRETSADVSQFLHFFKKNARSAHSSKRNRQKEILLIPKYANAYLNPISPYFSGHHTYHNILS